MEERRISSGNSCILVKDKSLLDGWNSPIYKWLKDEGFISWGRKGVYSGVDWVFINLTSKMFAPGMPGVSVTSVIGNHAITMDEFMTIYHIFKKYEGLERLRMSKEDQEEWHEKQAVYAEQNRIYWLDMTFDRYCAEVKDILIKTYTGIPKEEVPKYLDEEIRSLKDMFHRQYRPDRAAYILFMCW